MSGSRFVATISGLSTGQRRQAVVSELLSGNVPEFLRHLKPVELTLKRRGVIEHTAVIWVTPDYLAVGGDDDFVRMPMGLYSAVTVARSFGFILPTRKMVDAIHEQAEVHVTPQPMRPGKQMTSVDYLFRHDQMIKAQLIGHPPGQLVSGQKKDVVLTNRLVRKARRVAIYGWIEPDGTPIQPLSTVHDGRYADYSHGVRLVSATVLVDGQRRSVFQVLESPELAKLLSYEGPILNARQVMALPLPAPMPTPASS